MGDGADEFSVLEYGAAGHALDDTAGEVKALRVGDGDHHAFVGIGTG